MNKELDQFGVAIIGRGITGVSTAYFLQNLGIKNVALIGPDRTRKNCASLGSTFISSAPEDNITRGVHNHGLEVTRSILKMMSMGFESLESIARANELPWRESKTVRLALSQHELDEMNAAVNLYRCAGIHAVVSKATPAIHPGGVVGIQTEENLSAITDVPLILEILEHKSNATIFPLEALSIERGADGMRIKTSTETIHCEIVVVASHLKTADFIPEMTESLVSYADQWTSIGYESDSSVYEDWVLMHCNHSHYSFWKAADGLIYARGARFLRKMAGIDEKEPSSLPGVTKHLLQKATEILGLKGAAVQGSQGLLECKPCDELPVIGPWYGDSRLLLATGYSGVGISLGCSAGRGLAELIANGRSSFLSRDLYPHRLRSLSD